VIQLWARVATDLEGRAGAGAMNEMSAMASAEPRDIGLSKVSE